MTLARQRFARTREWVAAHAVQMYLGGMFTGMALLRLVESNNLLGGAYWAFVYLAVSHTIGTGLIWPQSRTLSAATGALITVVAAARISVVAQRTLEVAATSPENAVRGAVAILLWGLVVVLGMRWPRFTFDAEVRLLLQEARRDPQPGGRPQHGVV